MARAQDQSKRVPREKFSFDIFQISDILEWGCVSRQSTEKAIYPPFFYTTGGPRYSRFEIFLERNHRIARETCTFFFTMVILQP
jgi:hypothetical protein